MRKKGVIVLTAVFMVVFTILCAAYVRFSYSAKSGGGERKVIDRLDIDVSDTEFKFKNAGENALLDCDFKLTVKKTEPDFYCEIVSVKISGSSDANVVFTPLGKSETPPFNRVLASKDGEGESASWNIGYSVKAKSGVSVYNSELEILYRTGIDDENTQLRRYVLPLKIVVDK